MGVASKIPVRGGGTGGERSPRSDHQNSGGVTRSRYSEKYPSECLSSFSGGPGS